MKESLGTLMSFIDNASVESIMIFIVVILFILNFFDWRAFIKKAEFLYKREVGFPTVACLQLGSLFTIIILMIIGMSYITTILSLILMGLFIFLERKRINFSQSIDRHLHMSEISKNDP